jgi:pyridoxal phosphate enzyme (YggS family)
MSLATQIEQITRQIPPHVTLIAVTKTKPVSLLQEAYHCGLRVFGENKVQEMVDKYEQLPKDIQWHLIGHLQSNKVKYIAPFVTLIHSVDSFKLLQEINKQAKKVNRCIDCLLQIYIAEEDTKFGLSKTELLELLADTQLPTLTNIRIIGLMGMATNTANTAQIQQEFRNLKSIFEEVKAQFAAPNISWQHISMGMSGDYEIAIAEGSTMVRIGSAIFGHRA